MRVLIVSVLLAWSLGAAVGPPPLGEVEHVHVRREPHDAVITAAPEAAARLEQRQILGADWMGFAYYSGQCEFPFCVWESCEMEK